MANKKGKKKMSSAKKQRIIIGVVGAIIAVGVILTGVVCSMTYFNTSIHSGVSAGQIDLSGMSVTQAIKYISDNSDIIIADDTAVQIDINGTVYPILVKDVTNGLDSELSAKAAYDYTHEGSFATRVSRVFTAYTSGITVPLEINVDDDKLKEKVEEIEQMAVTTAIDQSYTIEDQELVIDMGQNGVGLDSTVVANELHERITNMNFEPLEVEIVEQLPQELDFEEIIAGLESQMQNATVDKTDGVTIIPSTDSVIVDLAEIQSAISNANGAQTVRVPITVEQATVTTEELTEVLFRDTLATAQTTFSTSNTSRANNVSLAAANMDGTILNPGEVFSYNDVVGERTTAAGFLMAGAYSAGELVEEVGGGVCQPSSTLYMAVLRADLEVVYRQNHGMTVSYTPLGEDATVSYGYIDFKFQNDTDYPLRVDTSTDGGVMKVTLVGTKTTDKTVTTDRDIVTLTPEVKETVDNTLAVGERVIDQAASTGYKVTTYKIITENGVTTTEVANTSTYSKKDEIARVGPDSKVTLNDDGTTTTSTKNADGTISTIITNADGTIVTSTGDTTSSSTGDTTSGSSTSDSTSGSSTSSDSSSSSSSDTTTTEPTVTEPTVSEPVDNSADPEG